MKPINLAAAVLCVSATSASAQAQEWSGWYGGFSAGVLAGGYEDSTGLVLDYGQASIGAFGGYRADFGGVLLGGEATGEGLLLGLGDGSAVGLPQVTAGLTSRFAVRATLGLPQGSFVPYMAAGPVLAYQRYTAGTTGSDTRAHLGGEVAVGVDMAITEAAFVRAEARYSMFSTETYNIGLGNYSAKARGAADAKLGIGFRF